MTARGRSKFNGQLAEIRIDGHKVGAAEAGDVHERLRPRGEGRDEVLQARAGRGARRPRRGRPRRSGGCRHGSAAGSPGTTACARSRSISARRTSCGCASASGGPSAAIRARSPTTCSPTSQPHEDAEAARRARRRRRRDARRRGPRGGAARRQRPTFVTGTQPATSVPGAAETLGQARRPLDPLRRPSPAYPFRGWRPPDGVAARERG